MTSPVAKSTTSASKPHVALRALLRSVAINIIAPVLIYRLTKPHFPGDSIFPLALSGAPALAWLAFSIVKLKSIDFLGLFAAENIAINIIALLVSHSERAVLIRQSFQSATLAPFFLVSLFLRRPMMFYLARQLNAGTDPVAIETFNAAAGRPASLRIYRNLTLMWAVALLVKSGVSYVLAQSLSTSIFLIASPAWDLASDTLLVTITIAAGRKALRESQPQ